MTSQTTILIQHGLIKAETATQKDWQTIDILRDKRFSLPLEWERIQQILTNHPSIRPYLYLSTGLDGLVLLNTDTGETASAQPLIFEILSNENDTMFHMVEQYVCRWDETTPTKTLIRQGRIDEAKQQIEHATMLAPTALMELVYQLVPWEGTGRRAVPALDGVECQKERGVSHTPIRQASGQIAPADQALRWGRRVVGEDVRQAYNSA